MPERYGPVESATRAQLRSERIRLGEWGLATAAVQLAKRLDGETDTGRYARGVTVLDRTLARLTDMAGRRPAAALPADQPEPEPEVDRVVELALVRDRPVS